MGTANTAHRQFIRMENEVQQALAEMEKETGKIPNYCQLMRHPKYKKMWGTLAANKFGLLVQGIGGRIREPTQYPSFVDMRYPTTE